MAEFDAVFEGGGAKGTVFLGALEVLHEQGGTLQRVVGTSAGAITAALCAAGYTTAELREAVLERLPDGKPRFSSFMDIPAETDFTPEEIENSLSMRVLREIDVPFIPGWLESTFDKRLLSTLLNHRIYSRIFSFTEAGGYYSGHTFRAWLEEKLQKKGIVPSDTLQGFHQKTGSDLSVVASDTSDVEMLVLNHRTAPNVPVSWAVRMSMSIPFVWQEVVWQEPWGLYRGRRKTGNTIVDGGVLSNFPIRLVATMDDEVREIMGDTDPRAAGNLGLMIDESLSVAGQPDTRTTPTGISSLRTIQRLSRLVDTMMGAKDNELIRRFANEICRLPAKGYGTLEFDMQGKRLDDLIQAGRDAMTNFLTRPAGAGT
jgi:NTE family protein